MTIAEKRQYLLDKYPGSESWKYKIGKMSDAQIIAVYLRLKQRELNYVQSPQ